MNSRTPSSLFLPPLLKERDYVIEYKYFTLLLLKEKELEDEVKRMAEEGSIVIVLITLKRC